MEENSGFRCENCQRTFTESNLSYNYSVRIGDYSSTMYMQCMGEIGEAFIGMSAKDFHAVSTENPEAAKKMLHRRMFLDYTVLIRANM
jgi:replication factor A1